MANEIKATATLDDKLSPGLTKIEQSLQKFSFSTDGVLSKLARSFSATDIAVGVLVGTFAKMTSVVDNAAKNYVKLNEQLRESGKLYDPIIDAQDRLNSKMEAGLTPLGALVSRWGRLVQLLAAGVPLVVAMAQATSEAATGAAIATSGRHGASGGWEGGPKYNPRDWVPPSALEMFLSKWKNQSNQEPSTVVGPSTRQPYSPWETMDARVWRSTRWRPEGRFGGGDHEDMTGDFGTHGVLNKHTDRNELIKEKLDKAQGYVDQLANGIGATFSGMLFDGMRLSDGLKGIFRSLVDDLIGELSQRAATGIVKGVLTGGLFGLSAGGGVGVEVGPASVRSSTAALSYERARGR